MKNVSDNELVDFRYLKADFRYINGEGIENEIELFYEQCKSPYDRHLLNFLSFYENKIKEARKKRNEMEMAIRQKEDKNIKIIKDEIANQRIRLILQRKEELELRNAMKELRKPKPDEQ